VIAPRRLRRWGLAVIVVLALMSSLASAAMRRPAQPRLPAVPVYSPPTRLSLAERDAVRSVYYLYAARKRGCGRSSTTRQAACVAAAAHIYRQLMTETEILAGPRAAVIHGRHHAEEAHDDNSLFFQHPAWSGQGRG
jgi:hypothetical protein